MLEKNQLVSINYEVMDSLTNEIIDSSKDSPLAFITGHSQVIEGLEKQVMAANVGDKIEFSVEPELGYGVRNPELMQEVSREQFGDIDLKVGMTLFGQAENGMPVQVIVADISENSVMVDYNHPLAGKTLNFKVEILSSREATDDEIIMSMGGGGCCGGGGHSHGGGGCCGGGGGGCGCSTGEGHGHSHGGGGCGCH